MKQMFSILAAAVFMLSCQCAGNVKSAAPESSRGAVRRVTVPDEYGYRVKAVYPHDSGAYTQGLFWHGGSLYESAGQYGESRLLKVDLKSGRATRRHDLRPGVFAEGAALLDGKIYQLSWREWTVFVYDADTFESVGTFRINREGWGITTDGEKLYYSDGSDKIYVVNPADFAEERTISVRLGRNVLRYINELEWIEGEIWANVYTTDKIVAIDPATGHVTKIIDLAGLLPAEDFDPDSTDVLNGIAYDPEGGRIFVTGKYWNKLFEIEPVRK